MSGLDQTSRQVDAQQALVSADQKAYDIAQARLYTGTIDILTVLSTQNALFQAQDVLAQDRLAQIQSSINLFLALGGGWRRDATDAGGR